MQYVEHDSRMSQKALGQNKSMTGANENHRGDSKYTSKKRKEENLDNQYFAVFFLSVAVFCWSVLIKF